MDKLRICTEHFPEEMIATYTSRRCLKDCAIPTLHLPQELDSILVQDSASITSGTIADIELNPILAQNSVGITPGTIADTDILNVQDNPESVIVHQEDNLQQVKHITTVRTNERYVQKLRRVQKLLYKKKIIIQEQRQKINKLRRGNTWEKVTADLSGVQKIFFETLSKNLKSAPQVHFLPSLMKMKIKARVECKGRMTEA